MALSSWVDCLVSIRFDLDIGPKIECISPPEALTAEGKVKLLHCAFPDCNPDCGYNFIFYFTMPDCTTAAAQSFSQTVAPPTTGHTVPELYGAAFYRQKHDPKVPRRYVQQVVVLLSHLPYYNVHELILRVVAPRFCQCCRLSPDTEKVPVSSVLSPVPEAYFEVDQSYTAAHYTQDEVLRDAMQELAQWPSPHPQVRYSVNLLQQALVFLTPAHSLRQSLRASRSSYAAVRRPMSVDDRVEFVERVRGSARHRGSSFGNDVVPLFSLLGEQLHHLTYVWELVLRHEPLFILSNTPCVASATAFSVASLILPIQYNGTLRSYFTVQNEDFPRLSRMGKALPFPSHEALLVAGTNPFLLRSFSGWPSLLVVMDRNAAHMVNGSVASPASSAAREAHGGELWGSRGLGSPPPPSKAAQAQPPRTALLEGLRAESPPLPAHGAGGLGGSVSASLSAATTGAGEGTNASASSFVESAGSSSSSTAISPHHSSAVNRSTSPGRGIAGPPLTASSSANPLFFSRRQVESVHTHVTVVPTSTGSGVALSALVGTPTSSAVVSGITTTTTATLATSTTAVYHADPHATYALESSSGESHSPSSRSSTPPSRPASFASPASATAATAGSSEAEDGPAASAGTSATARSERGDGTATPLTADTRTTPATMTPTHSRVASTNPTKTAAATAGGEEGGLRESGSAAAPASVSSRLSTSPPAALATMPAPPASSVTLFTMRNYQTTVESVNAVDYRKRGGGHQEVSRTNLQQRLHNYFDSSVHFLLNHAEQSKMLLKRLEMVSLLDAEAQRTSVTLSLHQWQGSPTTVSSPWRHTSNNSGSNGGGTGGTATPSAFPAVPPSPASSSSAATAAGHHSNAVDGGVTSCSHFSVADDILRKFFTSLTNEFLTPVTAWYTKVTAPYTAFHLCDRALCDSLLSPTSFLSDFALRHRETAPLMWTQLHSFKTYKVIYERFAHGCLFKAYVSQLIDEDLRRQLDTFQIEEWVVRVPSEAERIDLLISLLSTIQRELNETLDPDVLFVTSATSVMASMAVGLREPHREQFMLKIGELKL